MMDSPKIIAESLFEQIGSYSAKTLELTKLRAVRSTAVAAPVIIARMIVWSMLTMCTIITTFGLAFFLGDILGKLYYGFFIVAAVYLFASIIMHFFLHSWIKNSLIHYIIRQSLG
jgi:hypothetical protein